MHHDHSAHHEHNPKHKHTHTHDHTHDHAHNANGNAKRLLWAFLITAFFMLVEVLGGLISGSLALLADAGHMLTDAGALAFALLAVYFARRPPTLRHTFGYLRLTTLATFLNALALFVITIFIFIEALERFANPQIITGKLMLGVAVAGLIVNIIAFVILHSGGGEKNMNVRAAALHVLGDLLGSVAAIVASIVIIFTGWTPIDPILSILVCLLVLRSAWKLLNESINELLEATPKNLDLNRIKTAIIEQHPEILNIHHLHVWMVSEKPVMTMHIQLAQKNNHDDTLLKSVQDFLANRYQIAHCTIQIEREDCAHNRCQLVDEIKTCIHHH